VATTEGSISCPLFVPIKTLIHPVLDWVPEVVDIVSIAILHYGSSCKFGIIINSGVSCCIPVRKFGAIAHRNKRASI
jgi:hypothetical protein